MDGKRGRGARVEQRSPGLRLVVSAVGATSLWLPRPIFLFSGRDLTVVDKGRICWVV